MRRITLFVGVILLLTSLVYSYETNYTSARMSCSSDSTCWNLYPPWFTWLGLYNLKEKYGWDEYDGFPCNGTRCVAMKCPPACKLPPEYNYRTSNFGGILGYELGNDEFTVYIKGGCRASGSEDWECSWESFNNSGWWGFSDIGSTLIYIDIEGGSLLGELKGPNVLREENGYTNFYVKYYLSGEDFVYPEGEDWWVGVANDRWDGRDHYVFLIDEYFAPNSSSPYANRDYFREGSGEFVRIFEDNINGIEKGEIIDSKGRIGTTVFYHGMAKSSIWKMGIIQEYLDDEDEVWSYMTGIDKDRYSYSTVYYSGIFYPYWRGFYFKNFEDPESAIINKSGHTCVCKDEKLYRSDKLRWVRGSLGNCRNGFCTDLYMLGESAIFLNTFPSYSLSYKDEKITMSTSCGVSTNKSFVFGDVKYNAILYAKECRIKGGSTVCDMYLEIKIEDGPLVYGPTFVGSCNLGEIFELKERVSLPVVKGTWDGDLFDLDLENLLIPGLTPSKKGFTEIFIDVSDGDNLDYERIDIDEYNEAMNKYVLRNGDLEKRIHLRDQFKDIWMGAVVTASIEGYRKAYYTNSVILPERRYPFVLKFSKEGNASPYISFYAEIYDGDGNLVTTLVTGSNCSWYDSKGWNESFAHNMSDDNVYVICEKPNLPEGNYSLRFTVYLMKDCSDPAWGGDCVAYDFDGDGVRFGWVAGLFGVDPLDGFLFGEIEMEVRNVISSVGMIGKENNVTVRIYGDLDYGFVSANRTGIFGYLEQIEDDIPVKTKVFIYASENASSFDFSFPNNNLLFANILKMRHIEIIENETKRDDFSETFEGSYGWFVEMFFVGENPEFEVNGNAPPKLPWDSPVVTPNPKCFWICPQQFIIPNTDIMDNCNPYGEFIVNYSGNSSFFIIGFGSDHYIEKKVAPTYYFFEIYKPVIYTLSHTLDMGSIFHIFSPTSVPIKLIMFNYSIDNNMLTIRYPLLLAGCGDGICMPFRGERCYVRQCPECSEKNLGEYYYGEDLYNKYRDCIASNNCYNISYCFCPPTKDWGQGSWGELSGQTPKERNCPPDVRDIYGCVIIKDINQEAKAECQCRWNKELVLTTVGKEPNKTHYCCPNNSQIDLGYGNKGIALLDPSDFLYVEDSHCGNLTIQLAGICVPNATLIREVDCRGTLYLRTLTVWDFVFGNIKDQIKNCVKSSVGSRFDGKLVYFINYTYYNSSEEKFELVMENQPRNAPIYLDNCTFDDFNVPYDKEECSCENEVLGFCLKYHCYLYWKGEKTAEYIASWFEDWSLWKYEARIYLVNITNLKCKGFTAYTMEGVYEWENAPYQGYYDPNGDGELDYANIKTCQLKFPPYIFTFFQGFVVYDISGSPVPYDPIRGYYAKFTHAPPRGYG